MSSLGALTGQGRALQRLLQELKGEDALRPLVLAGDPDACERLRRALGAAPDTPALRLRVDRPVEVADLTDAAALVLCLDGPEAAPAQEAARRLADRRRVRLVALLLGAPEGEAVEPPPYVLATDCVRAGGRAAAARHRARAARRGRDAGGWALGRALPALRRPIAHALTGHYSTLNGGVGAAVFVPGADLPVLTLNQLRLAARIAALHGIVLDRGRLKELVAVVGVGFGMRAVARQLLGVVPGPGWALKGAVAYGGTRAIGEAALRWAERQAVDAPAVAEPIGEPALDG
ncbi:MAG: hypothetical protein R3C15_14395 [Thermoleophilia bacterium]